MSDAHAGIASLNVLEGELVGAVRKFPSRQRRRRLAALFAIAIAVPAGYAGAGQLIGVAEPPPVVIKPDDIVKVGYLDPVTGEPVRCPDGSVFFRVIRGRDVEAPGGDVTPTCPDGSTPAVYLISQRQQERFIENAPVGTDLSKAPGLKSFVIERTNGGR